MLFFRSLPAEREAIVRRDPSTGLIWGSASVVSGSVRNTMSTAGSTVLVAGLPAVSPNSEASGVEGTGKGGGGCGLPGSQGATSAVGLAGDAEAAGSAGCEALGPSGTEASAAPQGVAASADAASSYRMLLQLPGIIGATPATGKRALGADTAVSVYPLPPPTPREIAATDAVV